MGNRPGGYSIPSWVQAAAATRGRVPGGRAVAAAQPGGDEAGREGVAGPVAVHHRLFRAAGGTGTAVPSPGTVRRRPRPGSPPPSGAPAWPATDAARSPNRTAAQQHQVGDLGERPMVGVLAVPVVQVGGERHARRSGGPHGGQQRHRPIHDRQVDVPGVADQRGQLGGGERWNDPAMGAGRTATCAARPGPPGSPTGGCRPGARPAAPAPRPGSTPPGPAHRPGPHRGCRQPVRAGRAPGRPAPPRPRCCRSAARSARRWGIGSRQRQRGHPYPHVHPEPAKNQQIDHEADASPLPLAPPAPRDLAVSVATKGASVRRTPTRTARSRRWGACGPGQRGPPILGAGGD